MKIAQIPFSKEGSIYNRSNLIFKGEFRSYSVLVGLAAFLIFLCWGKTANAAKGDRLVFDNLSLPAISVDAPSGTGLDMIYVCYDTENSSVKFATQNQNTKWYKYSNLGGGYAEEITSGITYSSGYSVLDNPASDMGYIIEDGDNRAYFWIVGYKGKRLTLDSVSPSLYQECDFSVLDVKGEGGPLHYFTINGQQKVLSREIEITYQTLTFDESALVYKQGETKQKFESLSPEMKVAPPAYCQTVFQISGDRFLKKWNWLEEISSAPVNPHAVMVYTTAEQADSDTFTKSSGRNRKNIRKGGVRKATRQDAGDGEPSDDPNDDSDSSTGEDEQSPGSNVITAGISGLGGSAPVDISFKAYISDGVLHSDWQMASNPEFDPVDYHFYQQDLDYTFLEEGTFYLRFIGSNSDGSCEAVGETYTVTIGASELRIPNVFTPNGDGVNDEWKVAYRSLIKFECWIFDRYGKEVCHLTSPDQGWDGKISGKEARPGVYYYVIEAQGADGKKYKESGDINILKYVGGSKTDSGVVE